MKIAIGMKLQEGAFGGGNQFAKQLVHYLQSKGEKVCFDLNDNDIDLILMTDPREYLDMINFGPMSISRYLSSHPRTLVAHRVNECDERKNTQYMNAQIVNGNSVADHTIYVSGWLKELYDKYGINLKSHCVILNGADEKTFNWVAKKLPPIGEKIRIVTHHFSAHFMKGWDVYLELDKLISTDRWKNRLEFHFIGNAPKDISTTNIIFHPPTHGQSLALELSKNHLYVTASQNEPGSNHQLEGAMSGLPVIYKNSGGIPETCHGFGIQISSPEELEKALEDIIYNYDQFQLKLKDFPLNGSFMCRQYEACFEELMIKREALLKTRQPRTVLKKAELIFRSRYYQILDKLRIY